MSTLVRLVIPALLSLAGTLSAAPAASAETPPARPALEYEVDSFEWHDAKRDRTIPAKVFAPVASAAAGRRPTIVFSHGYGESRDSFDYLGTYWAQHGYIGVFLSHPGSDREALKTRGGPRGDIETTFDPRPADIRFVLDQLASADPGSKLLRGRVDLDRLAMAGQCMGSTTAFYMVGLQIQRADGTHYSDADPRFKVVIALSPQMPRDLMLEGTRAAAAMANLGEASQRELYAGSWAAISVPALVVTGSRDFDLFPAVRNNPSLIRMAYDGLPAGDHYLVNIIGAEHDAFTESEPYYRSGPRDPRHYGWIGEATTGFLDAYLLNDATALAWLQDATLNQETKGEVQQENKTGRSSSATASVPAPASAASSSPATQGAPGAAGGGRSIDPAAILKRFDSNGDGELSRDEAPPRLASRAFDSLDRDGSGKLSEQELQALVGRAGGGQSRGAGAQSGGASTSGAKAASQSDGAAAAAGPVVDVAAGSYALASKDLTLTDSGRNVPVKIRVSYPLKVTGRLPVIVFSPHQSGSPDQYTELLEQWAAHGYVCIALSHADTPNSGRSSEPGYTDRPKDVSFIIDRLDDIANELGGFDGELDRAHVGVGGHYLGAYTAYLLAGAVRHPPDGGAAQTFTDSRVIAALLISPEGRGQGMDEGSWAEIKTPTMTITGSLDYSARASKDPEWRSDAYKLSAPGDKYLVDIEGYQSTRRAPGHEDAQTYSQVIGEASASYVYSASLDFWDAYLKGDRDALTRLQSGALQSSSHGAVTLSHK